MSEIASPILHFKEDGIVDYADHRSSSRMATGLILETGARGVSWIRSPAY